MNFISIRGARTHNLKNIDLDIPRDQLIVITGLSGSGKSSLAFDTLYAEGQRRYVESLSAYARQFLSLMEKPDIDHIEGLSPAISIEQKSTSHNPRSTVGTITEIYDYLRLLFARVGTPYCPEHHLPLNAKTITQMIDQVMSLPEDTKIMILSPMIQGKKGEYVQLFQNLLAQGYLRAQINGEIYELSNPPSLDLHKKHTISVIIDRLKINTSNRSRIADSIESALRLSAGILQIDLLDPPPEQNSEQNSEQILEKNNIKFPWVLSSLYACPHCHYSIPELEPRLFSFNSPQGACEKCDGLGLEEFFDPNKIIADKTLSLSKGALRGWNRTNMFYYHQLISLAAHYNFSLEIPLENLPEKILNILLWGSQKEKIKIKFISHDGKTFESEKIFEGIIPLLEQRYREVDSTTIREELNKYKSIKECRSCEGKRLKKSACAVLIQEESLPNLTHLAISDLFNFFDQLTLEGAQAKIAEKILKEIKDRLSFLINVGLDYLSLDRKAETLSGGEAQRIRLASQIGAGLVGVMYVLDEPSIGLHQRDNERLLKTLFHLRDLGNTVIVVEHDEDTIKAADYIIDIGPGAGVHGGKIVAAGDLKAIKNTKDSITGLYLNKIKKIDIPKTRKIFNPVACIELQGARGNNLKNINIKIPISLLTCVTGVSGSGKSTLINDTLYPIAARKLNGAQIINPAPYDQIKGLENLDKVVDIDQSPIGRTPRSNPATYVGLFSDIRDLFAGTEEARAKGYKPGRFSFNVKGGRCEACEGDGVIKVEMHFLPDVYVTCDHCQGKRYNRETLEIKYKNKNIHEILNMTVEEAADFFSAVPSIYKKLETLLRVGLSYIQLGQRATTLSGGEAQRIKLSKELARRDTGQTLYILDEPTTGLHFEDVRQLLEVLHELRDRGNTLVIIEHNLDVIKTADYIIDLGPEGGHRGGEIIAVGSPEKIAENTKSVTGKFLKPLLKN